MCGDKKYEIYKLLATYLKIRSLLCAMHLSILGSGYVGITSAACLAELGNTVSCFDIDTKKISTLTAGHIPFYEPGLKELVEKNVKAKRLAFTSSLKEALSQSQIVFICVGTPQDASGKADLKYVFDCASMIAKQMESSKVIVIKSTVPVGTCKAVQKHMDSTLRGKRISVSLASNPEFLREGSAIKDFMNPDRIILGVEDDQSREALTNIYKGIERTDKPIVITDIATAELTKYAANAMLATRISFMNQLSQLCEKTGADIKMIAKGIGLDSRIGPRFLQAGVGYGGSCFPKDVRALIHILHEHDCSASLFEAVDQINLEQRTHVTEKILTAVPQLKGKTIAVWGLSFKPKTDDIRDAPSLTIISNLLKKGVKIRAYDPVANAHAKEELKKNHDIDTTHVQFCDNAYSAAEGADGIVVITEWDEFRYVDKEKIKSLMHTPLVIDGRNIYDPKEMKELGFTYVGVGR